MSLPALQSIHIIRLNHIGDPTFSLKCIPFQLYIGILPELSSNFAIQRQNDHGFSAVACDQTIEQTVNRDSKTKGGVTGFSMNRASVHRWLLSQSERAAITQQCKAMSGVNCIYR